MSAATEAILCATTTRWLKAALVPLVASGALAALAWFALLVGVDGQLLWWIVAALLLPALWIGIRVRFDAGLFEDLANHAAHDRPLADQLAALDEALAALGLRRRGPTRSVGERARGACRLAVWQAIIAALQLVLALLAASPVMPGAL